jgi:hypothetical protein
MPPPLYAVVLKCWNHRHEDRPTSGRIVRLLRQISDSREALTFEVGARTRRRLCAL